MEWVFGLVVGAVLLLGAMIHLFPSSRQPQAERVARALGGEHATHEGIEIVTWAHGRVTLSLHLGSASVILRIPSGGLQGTPAAPGGKTDFKGRVTAASFELSDRAKQNLDVIRRLDFSPGVTIELQGTEILLTKPSPLGDDETLLFFVKLAMPIVDEIIERGRPLGVEILQDTRKRKGNCQVCGTTLEACIVQCASCATPHHTDCWNYLGRCSTFGCGSTRFV